MSDFTPQIIAVQVRLNALGHYRVNVDGLAGPQTWGAITHELGIGVDEVTAANTAHVIAAVQKYLFSRGLFVGGVICGQAGPITWGGILRALDGALPSPAATSTPASGGTILAGGDAGAPLPAAPLRPPAEGTVDPRSEHAILSLHPRVQPLARQMVIRVNAALAPGGQHGVIVSATRTYAEQQALYEKHDGTTNAPAGWSNHNFQLAFDLAIFRNSEPVWESPLYETLLAPIARDLGFTCGIDWASFRDDDHFELHPEWAKGLGESAVLAGLRARHADGRDAFAA